MNKKVIPPEPDGVQEVALREALEERYLAYALSTIMHRALPDARDGLKSARTLWRPVDAAVSSKVALTPRSSCRI